MSDLEHTQWEELVAGYALDALEPGDEADVRAHLASCAGCRAVLEEHRQVAAALAGAIPAVPPAPTSRAALLDALDREPPRPRTRQEAPAQAAAPVPPAPEPETPQPETPQPASPVQRRWERLRAIPVAVALVAVVVAGLSVVVARQQGDARREQTDRARQVALCVRDTACKRVDLAADGRSKAIALVRDGHVQLVVDALPANDETSRIYVLWQLADGTPRAVGSFDVRPGGTVTGMMPLPDPAVGSTLAITLESGRTPPSAPGGAPVAAGTVA